MRKSMELLALVGMITISLCACGSMAKSDSTAAGTAMEPAAATVEESVVYDTADVYMNEGGENTTGEITATQTENNTSSQNTNETERKLITTMYLSVETSEIDSLMNTIEERTENLGGYIESSLMESDSNGKKTAHYTIRIPEEDRNDFVTMITGSSNVLAKSSNVEDVTLSYVDMQSRIDVLEEEIDRLQQMLADTQDVDTMLSLEARLSDVITEKECMESQIRLYDNLISYSTINIDIKEVVEFTVVEDQKKENEKTAWERMSEGFTHNLVSILNGFKNFGIGLVIILPYLILFALIIIGVYFVIKMLIKREDNKAKKRKESMQNSIVPPNSILPPNSIVPPNSITPANQEDTQNKL